MSELPPLSGNGSLASMLLQVPRGRTGSDPLDRRYSATSRTERSTGEIPESLDQFAVLGEDVRIRFLALDRKLDNLLMQIGAGLDNLSLQLDSGIAQIKSGQKQSTLSNGIDGSPKQVPHSTWPHSIGVDSSAQNNTGANSQVQPSFKIAGHQDPNGDLASLRRTSTSSDGTRISSESSYFQAQALLAKGSGGQSALAHAIWRFLEDPDSSWAAAWYPRIWTVLIIASVFVTMLQTLEDPVLHGTTGEAISFAFDVLFTLEVLLRFFVSPGYYIFFRSPNNLIDVLAALPVFLRVSCLADVLECGEDAVPTAILRCIVPSIQLLKILRHFEQFHLFLFLAIETLDALVVLYFLLFFIVLFSASVVYLVEPRENIESVPIAMYLIIATVSTVGYGDIVPSSTVGTFAVSIIIVTSVLFMAMPIGIVGNAFTQIWSDRDRILLTIRTRDRLAQWGYTAADMQMLFRHFDKNHSGDLNLKEFRTMMSELRIGLSEDRVCRLFESFDEDGSGSIDPMEFTKSLFPSTYLELHSMSKSGDGIDQSDPLVICEEVPLERKNSGEKRSSSKGSNPSRTPSKEKVGRGVSQNPDSNANSSKFKGF